MEMKVCEKCGKKFSIEGRSNNVKFCSYECQTKANNERQSKRYRDERIKKKRKNKNADLVNIAVEAKKAGMTYGEYVLKNNL